MSAETSDLPVDVARPVRVGALALFAGLLACVLWSVLAPLATTIHVSGSLSSSQPSVALQPAYGGTLAWVGVELHDEVQKGQEIFRLDTELERRNLVETEHLIEIIHAENLAIDAMLFGQHDRFIPQSPTEAALFQKYMLERTAHHSAMDSIGHDEKIQRSRVETTGAEIDILAQRLDILDAQTAKKTSLHQQGLARDADLISLETQRFQVLAAITQKRGQSSAAANQAAKAAADRNRMASEYTASLIGKRQDNDIRLAELRGERARLTAIIKSSQIRAPVAGNVLSLPRATAGAFVPRGETIVEIAEQLQAPQTRLMIPASAIDQVRTGMEGRLTITSLSQREAPTIFVRLSSIALEAEKDREGNVKGYPATATITNPDVLDDLISRTGIRLSADMPVSAALSGRTITFAQYLVAPFLAAFDGALQD